MDENLLENESIRVATQVIIHAGNARVQVNKAMDCLEKFEFEDADLKLKKAEKEITKAHAIQTDIIQAEARGDEIHISLLLIHAQDTLMSAKTEIQMTSNFLRLFRQLRQEIAK